MKVENMKLKQKTGGREKGTPNKLTQEVKEILAEVVNKELLNVGEVLESLQPKERLEIVIKMLPYVTPKLRDVELNLNESEPIVAQFGTKQDIEEELIQIMQRLTGYVFESVGDFKKLSPELLEKINAEFKLQTAL